MAELLALDEGSTPALLDVLDRLSKATGEFDALARNQSRS
jgi:hypothetical protein